jgi:hypothetical protein
MKAFVPTVLLVIVVALALDYTPVGISSPTHVARAAVQDSTFMVVNVSLSAYRIGTLTNPTLTLTRGQTYTFSVNAFGHPFYIKTARTIGTTNLWNDGVIDNGLDTGDVIFGVPNTAPNALFYQCGVHSAMGGTLNIVTPVSAPGVRLPGVAWLGPAMPNPVRRGAQFIFDLQRVADIDFTIFDSQGRRTRVLDSGSQVPGRHMLNWDGRDEAGQLTPSGIYFYRLSIEGRQLNGRFSVAR